MNLALQAADIFRLRARDVFANVVRVLDYALIISGGPGRRSLTESTLQRLYSVLPREPAPYVSRSLPCESPKALEMRHAIARAAHTMDVAEFQAHLEISLTPIIIPGAIDHWPAATKWSDVQYLLDCTLDGRRMVPIEIGSSYTDDGWSQKIISFAEFVETYLVPNKPVDVGYLAQHDLFTQIPTLREDILVPDYCYATPPSVHDDEGDTDEVRDYEAPLMNAWLGPKGTKTPLHTDPYHNILCQVVGYKYVRLYAPDQTQFLYPRKAEESGVNMENTSSVDLFYLRPEFDQQAEREVNAQEIHAQYPLVSDAVYQEAILGPGECLYIPLGWWHYLESLTPSFSVSFWWK
jgi:lysine-specific demethylase 8